MIWSQSTSRASPLTSSPAARRAARAAAAFSPALRQTLSDLGVEVVAGAGEDSGLHAVFLRDGRLEGAADPRREGIAEQL